MTSPPHQPEQFADAINQWDLDKLYADLTEAKQRWAPHTRRGLTNTEKEHLRGLLCGCSPADIARQLQKDEGTVKTHLTKSLYRYIETLTEKKPNSLSNWREVIDWLEEAGYRRTAPPRQIDLDGAPDVSIFYDRAAELTQLQQWIVKDSCRFVALLGMGGIGKTALAVKLVERIQDEFELVIWRSLQNAPPLNELLANLLQFLPRKSPLAQDTSGRISQLIECLRDRRTLIILDGVETLLQPGKLAGKYRDGYQEYGRLFREIGESDLREVGKSQRQSCLVITCYEKPREIVLSEGETRPVRSFKLGGLPEAAARKILKERGLVEQTEWAELIQRYRGNPLALRIVSATIKNIFNGKVDEFLGENTTYVGEIREILAAQFDRLSEVEIKLMCLLASDRQPVPHCRLREGIASSVPNSQIIEALESLEMRSLIETTSQSDRVLFALQPVVRKYAINRFNQIESGCHN